MSISLNKAYEDGLLNVAGTCKRNLSHAGVIIGCLLVIAAVGLFIFSIAYSKLPDMAFVGCLGGSLIGMFITPFFTGLLIDEIVRPLSTKEEQKYLRTATPTEEEPRNSPSCCLTIHRIYNVLFPQRRESYDPTEEL